MTIHKLESPDPLSISFIGSESDAERRVRIIMGVGYTDAPAAVQYAVRHGYGVSEVESIPTDYLAGVANLDAYPVQVHGTTPDGQDPDARFKFTAADGHTAVDLRDVIAGTTK